MAGQLCEFFVVLLGQRPASSLQRDLPDTSALKTTPSGKDQARVARAWSSELRSQGELVLSFGARPVGVTHAVLQYVATGRLGYGLLFPQHLA